MIDKGGCLSMSNNPKFHPNLKVLKLPIFLSAVDVIPKEFPGLSSEPLFFVGFVFRV